LFNKKVIVASDRTLLPSKVVQDRAFITQPLSLSIVQVPSYTPQYLSTLLFRQSLTCFPLN
ncbi:hypothetical protein, partial [Brevibacillus porteri]|uniref:hypothetical protein n=1 Tax=Brevibacillus porteri TaxID=2126350 RepID=UPI002E204DF5|nr:hypothetical protein [Brevibacillus porteri]